MTASEAHKLLGVAPGASPGEIRAAYRRLARVNHPDRFATAPPQVQRVAQRKMSELNLAYARIGSKGVALSAKARESAHQTRVRREDAVREHRFQAWEDAERRARAGVEQQSRDAVKERAEAERAARVARRHQEARSRATRRIERAPAYDPESARQRAEAIHNEIQQLRVEIEKADGARSGRIGRPRVAS